MRQKAITILTLALLSTSAIAYDGQGFKIISEHTKSSAGFVGGFIEQPTKTLYRPAYASTWATTYDVAGKPYDYMRLSANHSVNLSNSTSHSQRYRYVYSLRCANVWETFDREIELNPNGTFSDSAASTGLFQPTTQGVFEIRANTQVTGADNSSHDAYAKAIVR